MDAKPDAKEPLDAKDSKDKNAKELKDKSANQTSFQRRILENILLEKYDSTTSLVGKLLWPTLWFVLSLMFYSDISGFIKQLSSNLARTSKINIAGVEIEVYADSLRGSDLEAYAMLAELNRSELVEILKLGEAANQIDPSFITSEYRERIEGLEDKGLLLLNEGATSAVDNTKTVVEINLTELGKRVYRELQSIMINFVIGLPEAQEVQP